jgi:hypothetical protein
MRSSPTTLHLLSAPPVLSPHRRPKSGTDLLPLSFHCSYYLHVAPKERPKSAGSMPSWYRSLSGKFGSEKSASSRVHPYSEAFSTTRGTAPPSPIYPTQGQRSETAERQEDSRLQIQTCSEVDEKPTASPVRSPELPLATRPRKVLLTEIDMRGVVISPPHHHTSPKKLQQSSVPFPHSAVFIVRIFDVGRTFAPLSSPHTRGDGGMQSYSSGLLSSLLSRFGLIARRACC